MKIEHLSVSRKQCYEDCTYCYKLRYNDKVKSPEPTPEYFLQGTICHLLAQLYVEGKGKIPIEHIVKQIVNKEIPVDEKWGKPVYAEMSAEYRKKFPMMVESVKSLSDKIGFDNETHTELPFSIDLDPPNNRKVVGFIDRLVIKNDKYFIFDYKTTKKGNFRKTSETVKQDLQMKTYAWAVQQLFPGTKAEDIQAALFYLEGANLVGARFKQETLDRTKDELLQTYLKIENHLPNETWGSVSWRCSNCDYRSMCPFNKKKNNLAKYL